MLHRKKSLISTYSLLLLFCDDFYILQGWYRFRYFHILRAIRYVPHSMFEQMFAEWRYKKSLDINWENIWHNGAELLQLNLIFLFPPETKMDYFHLFTTRVFGKHELSTKIYSAFDLWGKSHMLTLFSFISIGIHPKM